MFERNLRLERTESGGYLLRLRPDPELAALCEKHKGEVGVRITRPQSVGSEQQNRLMHGLMTDFFLSGMHSSPAKSIDEFKLWLKVTVGVCYDYEYQGRPVRVPKSWALYSLRERMEFIDALISMVIQSGASVDDKIQEILQGLSDKANINRNKKGVAA